jgi:PleD family two-component response regulator
MNILVVDDSEIVREKIISLLKFNYNVIEHSSSIGVTKKIFDNKINLLIIDLNMPELNGDKLINLLRNNKRLKDLKIILMSSIKHNKLKEIGNNVGADDIFCKCSFENKLISIIKKVS